MARTGMASLITELRGMTNTANDDYTVGGVSYWSADQLQQVLDRHRMEVVREALHHLDEYGAGGTANITRYYSRYGNYEQTTGGSAVFVVQDSTSNTVGTASYSVDYTRGEVIFAANTGGSAYYLTGRTYDLNAAAADVWERKAAQVAMAAYSWSSDNMRVDKSGIRKEALEMARYYRSLSGPVSVDLERGDT